MYRAVKWADLKPGDVVYIDNYQGGRYPRADPRTSGPYEVHNVDGRTLRLRGPKGSRIFMHFPEDLQVKDGDMRYSWYHNAHPRLVPGCRQCRKHLASHRWAKNQERHIGDRFPRLLLAMEVAACLSRGEALSCLRFYMRGDKWAGEAINHFGGTRAVILAALRIRHNVQTYSYAGSRIR